MDDKQKKDVEAFFNELNEDGFSFSELPGEEDAPDDKEADKKKKKPKGTGNEEETPKPEDDEESDEAASFLSKAAAKIRQSKIKHRKSLQRSIKDAQTFTDEFLNKLKDAATALEDKVNDAKKLADTVDNGSALKLAQFIKPLTTMVYATISAIKTEGYRAEVISADNLHILQDIQEHVSRITQAKSQVDMFSAIMSVRSLYLTLVATNKMLDGDVNLVNGANAGQLGDIYQLFQYNRQAGATSDATQDPIRDRDLTGDNAIAPDMVIIKPDFLLFVDDKLRRDLRTAGVCDENIAMLDNFALPTSFNGNGSGMVAATVQEEELTSAALNRVGTELNHPYPNFTWSHNGTDNIYTKTPLAYAARNQAFLKEMKDLYNKALANKLMEFSIDVCFAITLTNWLNSAFKVLVESHTFITGEVDKGAKLDEERLIGATNNYIAFKFLDEFPIGDKFNQSIFSLPIYFANRRFNEAMSKRLTYSEYAYKDLQKSYVSMTYKMPGSSKYFIGEQEVGSQLVKVIIAPKLYIPVDLLVPIDIPAAADVMTHNLPHYQLSRVRLPDVQPPLILDPFSFAVRIPRAKYIFSRNINEDGVLYNQSILHYIARLSGSEYGALLDEFYDNAIFTTEDNREVPLSVFFGTHIGEGAIDNSLGYPRLLTAIAPFYTKSAILGISPLTEEKADHVMGDETDMRWFAPIMDQYFNKQVWNNVDYLLVNAYNNWSLGNYLKALFNQHSDFSWVEAGIVAAMLYSGYVLNTFDDARVPVIGQQSQYPTLTYCRAYTNPNPTTATPEYYQLSTILRRAGHIWEEPKFNFLVTRFKAAFEKPEVKESSRISKKDIFRAHRFSVYTRGSNYFIVDNLFSKPQGDRRVWHDFTTGRVTNLKYLIKEDEAVKITADEVKKDILSLIHINENLMLVDSHNAAPLSFTSNLIAGTGLIGYRFPSEAERNRFITINRDNISKRLYFNDFCYINNDFYPTYIKYFLTLPTNTDRINTRLPNATYAAMSNIKFFDVTINALHRAGCDAGNRQGFRILLQSSFGLTPNAPLYNIVRENDAVVEITAANQDQYLTDTGDHVTNGYGSQNYQNLCNLTADQMESLQTSFRYPQAAIIPAYAELTGLPEFTTVATEGAVSLSKARFFYNLLDSIVPNAYSAYQTYQYGENRTRATLFDLRQGINRIAGDPETDLVITVPVRDILNVLELEEK